MNLEQPIHQKQKHHHHHPLRGIKKGVSQQVFRRAATTPEAQNSPSTMLTHSLTYSEASDNEYANTDTITFQDGLIWDSQNVAWEDDSSSSGSSCPEQGFPIRIISYVPTPPRFIPNTHSRSSSTTATRTQYKHQKQQHPLEQQHRNPHFFGSALSHSWDTQVSDYSRNAEYDSNDQQEEDRSYSVGCSASEEGPHLLDWAHTSEEGMTAPIQPASRTQEVKRYKRALVDAYSYSSGEDYSNSESLTLESDHQDIWKIFQHNATAYTFSDRRSHCQDQRDQINQDAITSKLILQPLSTTNQTKRPPMSSTIVPPRHCRISSLPDWLTVSFDYALENKNCKRKPMRPISSCRIPPFESPRLGRRFASFSGAFPELEAMFMGS